MKNIVATLSFLAFNSMLSAQVNWNFGTTLPNAFPSSSAPANLTISAISQQNNNGTTTLINNSSASSGYTGASGNYNAACAAKPGSLSVTLSTYFEITITPSSGYVVAVSGFNFGMRSTTTGPQNFSIRSGIDNYASDIATGTLINNSKWILEQPSISAIISAPGVAITFRIYGYNCAGTPSMNTATWRLDDLNIDAAAGLPSVVANPASLSAKAISSAQINLITAADASADNILIAYNSSNNFNTPQNNQTYTAGNSLSGAGTILYNGPAGTFNHTLLNASTIYYYRVWSVNSSNIYSSGLTTEATTFNAAPSVTELMVPQYAGATAGINNTARTPFATCLQFDDLLPNTIYDVRAALALPSDPATTYGVGNIWNSVASAFTSVAITVLSNAFSTNNIGSSGPVWLFFQPTASADFIAGSVVNIRAGYAVAGNTMPSSPIFIGTKNITFLDDQSTALTTNTSDDGAFLQGITSADFSGKYVMVYDNEEGNGDPLSAYQVMNASPVQSSQSSLPTAIDNIYKAAAASSSGYFPCIIPTGANNGNGIKRIEFRNPDYSIFSFFTVAHGNWNGQLYNANTTTIARNEVQAISILNSTVNDFYTNYNLGLLPSATTIVNRTLTLNNTAQLAFAPNSTLSINGIISGNGFLAGNNSSELDIGGTSGSNAGTLQFAAGKQLINNLKMNRTGVAAKIILGSDLLINNNLSLLNGVVATGNNLFSWANNGGALLTNAYSQSYVCTCDINGFEASQNKGSAGFKIYNVGSGKDIYFPVGTDYVSANRMMINNVGTADNFTVVVGKGDVGNTPLPRVSRIWYVTEDNAGGSLASMKLFFTKQNTSLFPSALNDEVETGFDYSDIHLVQKDYSNDFINLSNGSDIQDGVSASVGQEIYALYSKNISHDISGNTNGINDFSRFSIVNSSGIILPLSIVDFNVRQAAQTIVLSWKTLNEKNINAYEVQRSADGISFSAFNKISAKNEGVSNYTASDKNALNGNNFYRIKAIDKTGKIYYSGTEKINFNKNNNSLIIYPNPIIQNNFNVYFDEQPSSSFTINIIDNAGKIVLIKKFSPASNTYTIRLPQSFAAGNYHLKIFSTDILFNKEIIVER